MEVASTAIRGVGLYITAGLLCETMKQTNNSYKRMSNNHRPTHSRRTRRR